MSANKKIVIDARLNTEKISQDYKTLDKKTNQLIDKYNRTVDSIKSQELQLSKVSEELDRAKSKANELQLTFDETNNINYLIDLEDQQSKISNLTKKQELLNSKLSETKNHYYEIGQEIESTFNDKKKYFGSNNGIEDISNKIDKFKNKMTRLVGTAFVFSLIRSQLNNLRNGFVSLLKTDDNFNSSLNQIKANLMTAFAPIYNACLPALNSLMNSLSKLTGTIAIFVSSLFGQSLADSTKQAKKLNKALETTADTAEETSGSLSQIDHLDVIGNDSGGSGGGASQPDNQINYDNEISYSSKLLDFLNKIAEFVSTNKEDLIAFLFGLAGGITAIKLGLDPIMGLGIGLLILGVAKYIQDVIDFLNDPTWENFWKYIADIGIAVIGLGLIIGGPTGVITAIIGLIVFLVGLIIENWDSIKNVFSKGIDFIVSIINFLFSYLNGIFTAFTGIITSPFIVAYSTIIDVFNNLKNAVAHIVSGIAKLFTGDLKGALNDFKAAFKSVFNSLWTIAKSPINLIIEGINSLIRGINKISFDVPDWVPVIGGQKWGFNIPRIPKLAEGTVIPPRQEFMAILGDQKHGTNIEAPLDTIKQAQREVMEEFMPYFLQLNNQQREIVIEELSLLLKIGPEDMKRVVFNAIRLKEKELGKPLLVS